VRRERTAACASIRTHRVHHGQGMQPSRGTGFRRRSVRVERQISASRQHGGMAVRLEAMLGDRLRRARLVSDLDQREVGARAGVSQSTISRMELGLGANAPLATWQRVAVAVGGGLEADLAPARSEVPELDVAGRCHELLTELGRQGGWSSVTTRVVRTDGTVRSIETVLVRPRRCEVIVARVWDVIGDVEAAMDELHESVEREQAIRSLEWTVGWTAIVPASGTNRRRMTEVEPLLLPAAPMFGARWLSAIARESVPMPSRPGLIWTNGRVARLRPMLPYLDRRRRSGRSGARVRRFGCKAA